MTDLTPDAQAILDAGRDLDGAGDLEKARVRRALFAKIAAGGAVLTAASTAAADGGVAAGGGAAQSGAIATGAASSGATAAGGAWTLAKILIPIAVLVGGGAGGFVAWRAQRAMTPAPAPVVAPIIVPMPAPVVAPAPPAAPAVAPSLEPAPVHRAPPHHAHVAAPAHADAAPTNRLAEETALLAAANAELRRGDARRALSLLDDYDHRYPSGVLREEVLATRVIARCQLGAAPNKVARRGADAFLARHPASPLAPRVRSSCGE
jgi:hypothetical protein